MRSGKARLLGLLLAFLVCLVPLFAQSMKMDPPKTGAQPAEGGQTRTYYIAADDVMWDYVPSGMNQITGKPFESVAPFLNPRPGGKPIEKAVPTAYLKTLYREYTDGNFKTLKKLHRSGNIWDFWDH